ncbi:TRIM56 [Mytilus coruscus]|uniref:TRIM56 n=1 Tax=Mytilus coruscus TaxID=42192 RepID=A0A6J8BLT9_MYTCO|nr:TRIM56 [Mytilus coruscus]
MATAEVSSCKTDDDITTCTICLEQFNIPKYLPCLHTFCESCIATYITSAFEKDRTSIDCPICRSKVSAPDARITPEEWSKQMPLNFLLVGLIEKHKVERTEKICMSCERFDVNTKSEASSVCIDCSDALCANCTRCHKSNKLSLNHEIVQISDISKERKCENVLTIEEAAKNFRALNKVSKTENEVCALLVDLDTVLEAEKSSLVDMDAAYDSELQKCDTFWKILQKRIEELKIKWTNEYKQTFHSEKGKLELSIQKVENRKTAIANTKQILEATLKESSDVQLMIEVQKLNRYIEKDFGNFEISAITCKIEIQFLKDIDDIVKNIEEKIVINIDKKAKALDLSSSKCEECIVLLCCDKPTDRNIKIAAYEMATAEVCMLSVVVILDQ